MNLEQLVSPKGRAGPFLRLPSLLLLVQVRMPWPRCALGCVGRGAHQPAAGGLPASADALVSGLAATQPMKIR
jgi:hypothetical protein